MALLVGSFAVATGPIVEAEVGRPGWFAALPPRSRRRTVRLMIDTGASRSAVRGDVLRELGLLHSDQVSVSTPTQKGASARLCTVRLRLPGAPVLDDWTVLDLPAGRRGVDGLLGRDVLAAGLFVVHGPTGTWTLAL